MAKNEHENGDLTEVMPALHQIFMGALFCFPEGMLFKIREKGVQKEGEQDKGEGIGVVGVGVQLRKGKRGNRGRMMESELKVQLATSKVDFPKHFQ